MELLWLVGGALMVLVLIFILFRGGGEGEVKGPAATSARPRVPPSLPTRGPAAAPAAADADDDDGVVEPPVATRPTRRARKEE